MMYKNLQNETWKPDSNFLPYMFGGSGDLAGLEEEENEKIEQFEAGLAKEIKNTDPINEAVKKMVKAALSVEFGPELVMDKGAQRMIDTIASGIMGDPTLRKQALIIIDKLTETNQTKVIELKGKPVKENIAEEQNLY